MIRTITAMARAMIVIVRVFMSVSRNCGVGRTRTGARIVAPYPITARRQGAQFVHHRDPWLSVPDRKGGPPHVAKGMVSEAIVR